MNFRLLNTALLLSLSLSLFAQKSELQFEPKPWEEIQEIAKVNQKNVFLFVTDAKSKAGAKMEKDVFSDSVVSNFYNQRFVNMKTSLRLRNGKILAARYGIEKVPTLLFLDTRGNVLFRADGLQDARQMLSIGRQAFMGSLSEDDMDHLYQTGDRTEAFLKSYLQVKISKGNPITGQVLQAYLQTRKKSLDETDISLFESVLVQKIGYDVLIPLAEHRKTFLKRGREDFFYVQLEGQTRFAMTQRDAPLAGIQQVWEEVYGKDGAEQLNEFLATTLNQLERESEESTETAPFLQLAHFLENIGNRKAAYNAVLKARQIELASRGSSSTEIDELLDALRQ
ncbi:MAG: thioredoxin fold domain-containing protein [Bacteroidota bacterium]